MNDQRQNFLNTLRTFARKGIVKLPNIELKERIFKGSCARSSILISDVHSRLLSEHFSECEVDLACN